MQRLTISRVLFTRSRRSDEREIDSVARRSRDETKSRARKPISTCTCTIIHLQSHPTPGHGQSSAVTTRVPPRPRSAAAGNITRRGGCVSDRAEISKVHGVHSRVMSLQGRLIRWCRYVKCPSHLDLVLTSCDQGSRWAGFSPSCRRHLPMKIR